MSETAPMASERRAAILEGAVRVFSAHGFDAGTIRQIATEAGVSEGLIYRYFDSKEALLDTVIRERSILPWLDRPGALADGAPVAEALGALVREALARLEQNSDYVAVAWSQVATNPRVAAILGGLVRELTRRIAAYLVRKIAQGEIREVDVTVVARLLAASLIGFHIQEHRLSPPLSALSVRRYAEGLVDVLCRGMLVDEGKGRSRTKGKGRVAGDA